MSLNPRINTLSKQNTINNTVEYSYDNAKRPTSQTVDNDTISYTYDKEGNILTATNTTGRVSFTYENYDVQLFGLHVGWEEENKYAKENKLFNQRYL